MRERTASYDSECCICLDQIIEGLDTVVYYSPEGDWAHSECEDMVEEEDGFSVA